MSNPKSIDKAQVLFVERTGEIAGRLRRLLANDAIGVEHERSLERVVERFELRTYDVLIVSGLAAVHAGDEELEYLEIIAAKSPATQILFLIQPREIRLAMSALKAGGYQYARLPIGDDELRLLVLTAIEQQPTYGENLLLKQKNRPVVFQKMIGRSQAMQNVYRQIRQAASTDIPVLLVGETGTGKDLAAAAIHSQSERQSGPYVPIHLGALPAELVSSELFGHEKGAFTGAQDRHTGVFERAKGGTVLLDEIGTIDGKTQISLLRLLEQKRFHRIGGKRSIRADARLIAATNENLQEAVAEGNFREDLFYRLDVFCIRIPSLRERHGDITLLMDAFLKQYNNEFNKRVLGIAPECVSLLESYDWPGNVRELKNALQRAVLVCPGEVLLPEHLPSRFLKQTGNQNRISFQIGTSLKEVERELIVQTLKHTQNNRKQTALLLGISRRALYNKIDRYGL